MSLEHGSSGGHAMPPTFSGSERSAIAAPAPRRRRRRRPILIAGTVLLLTVGVSGVQLTANLGFDSALVSAQEATAAAEDALQHLEGAVRDLADTGEQGDRMHAAVTERLTDPAAAAELEDALTTRSEALSDAEVALEASLPAPPEKPVWPWALFAAHGELVALESHAAARADDRTALTRTMVADERTLMDAGLAVAQTAAAASVGFEADHIDAHNPDIVALRTAASSITAADGRFDAALVDAYAELESAADAMLRSQATAHWEKSGPLRDARTEVEAFARGLSPGLLLDFRWSPLVNGYGDGDSLGGRATWWYGDPGYATIELSDSVAREWPDDRTRALVAHEVGHAISVKCRDMYDDTDAATVEDWATAWAISMGYTDQANGTWAYGPPPQRLIDAAANCR